MAKKLTPVQAAAMVRLKAGDVICVFKGFNPSAFWRKSTVASISIATARALEDKGAAKRTNEHWSCYDLVLADDRT